MTLTAPLMAQDIAVRATTGVTPEAEQRLARLAEPLEIAVPADANPLDAVREFCGRVTPTYLGLLREANTSLETESQERTITVPACFVVRPGVSRTPLRGETLKSFAHRMVGMNGPKTIKGLLDSNPWLRRGRAETAIRITDPQDPSDPSLITVPFATRPAVYRLRKEAAANPQSALASIVEALPDAPSSNAVFADEVRLESDIDPRTMAPVTCPAAASARNDAVWPFDRTAVVEALQRNDAIRAASGMRPARMAILAVADNGVDGIGSFFPLSAFAVNDGEVPSDYRDNDGNEYADDIIGVNVMTGLTPVPLRGKDPWHGTHLSGIALGTRQFATVSGAAAVGTRVQLLPVSMVEVRKTGNLRLGTQTTPVMPTLAVELAFKFAMRRKASVINFSVSTDDELSILHAALTTDKSLLVVAAAGNQATDFDSDSRYPAVFGGRVEGKLALPVISVAAHDKRGCLAPFSGRGEARIDLAAPGVDVSSYDLGGGARVASGTSQATALVSFAAALLSSEGLDDPHAIKRRLLASVDPQPGLTGHVTTGGSLNIVKALSLFEDVIELPTGELLRVKLHARPAPRDVCPQVPANKQGELLKVSAGAAGGVRALIRWTKNGALQYLSCEPGEASISYTDATGPGVVRIADVADLVLRN